MLAKAIKAGTGSAASAKDYVHRENGHEPHLGETVEVVRGDPSMFAKVADNLDFVHKYSSAVIAFHPDDKPTDSQLEEIMDDWEQASFGDLDPSRFAQSFTAHKSDDEIHIHVLTARVDMQTGKSFNPMPPGWEKTFNAMCEKHNFKHGFVRPDDPVHARDVSAGHQHLVDADVMRKGLETSDNPKQMVEEFIQSRIEKGMIENREDVVQSLAELGEITRSGKNYISIKPEGFKKAIRLKGVNYEQEFDSTVARENTTESRARQSRAHRTSSYKSTQAALRFNKLVRTKSEYNRERYGADAITPRAELNEFKSADSRLRGTNERQVNNVLVEDVRDSLAVRDDNIRSDLLRSTELVSKKQIHNSERMPARKSAESNCSTVQQTKYRAKPRRNNLNQDKLAAQLAQMIINSILKLVTGGKHGYSQQEISAAIARTERLNAERIAVAEAEAVASADANRVSEMLASIEQQEARNGSELEQASERVDEILESSDSTMSLAEKVAQHHVDKVYEREQELNHSGLEHSGLELEMKLQFKNKANPK